jgi:hypothetical protein
MLEAGQTPHGARPNREGMEDGASRFSCVPARRAKLPGRSLEPFSNDRPRGMTVTAAMPYRIRLTGSTSLVAPMIGNDCGGFQLCGPLPPPLPRSSQIGVGLSGIIPSHPRLAWSSEDQPRLAQGSVFFNFGNYPILAISPVPPSPLPPYVHPFPPKVTQGTQESAEGRGHCCALANG